MIELLFILWAAAVLLIFGWGLDDVRQRLKRLQATLEAFVDDVEQE